ncbi:hypothetical protein JHK85_042222 [Glycine max]|nr:hypothetical protein JHK85_042222 [Glycine max]
MSQLVHHGMIFVPVGYTFGDGMYEMKKVKGGSPYGAGTVVGDGSRQPSELELAQAFLQEAQKAIANALCTLGFIMFKPMHGFQGRTVIPTLSSPMFGISTYS